MDPVDETQDEEEDVAQVSNIGSMGINTSGEITMGIGGGFSVDVDGSLNLEVAPGVSIDLDGD